MVGWHHLLNGNEFEQCPGDGEGQGSLACCSLWTRKDSDMTEQAKQANMFIYLNIVAVVHLLSCVQFFVTPWTTAHQFSLSFTISQSLLKLMSIDSVMPSKHLILCHPLLLLPRIFLSIRVFFNESVLCIRLAKVLELQLQHQSFQ